MLVTWDPKKSQSNRSKHGLSFDLAQEVFRDPLHASRQDRVIDGEIRWQSIGLVRASL